MNKIISKYRSVFSETSNLKKVPLSTVCIIDPSKKELNGINPDMEISFGMMADLGEHKRIFSPKGVKTVREVTKGGYSYFRENDVLLAKMTPCFENGKSGIALHLKNGIGFGSTEFYVLRPGQNILPDFIYSIISSEKFIQEGKHSLVGTTGRRRLIKHYVESFEIPVLSLEEQSQIVDLFKSIDSTIEHAEKQEKSLKVLWKTLCRDLTASNPTFGDLLRGKNCITTNFGKIALGIDQHDKLRKKVNRFIGLENIESDNLNISTWGNIDDGTTFTKRFSKGDVLFAKRRAYLRKVAVAAFDGVCSGDIIVMRANESLMLSDLLPFYASAEPFIEHAVNTSAGSLSPRTKWKDLCTFELAIPDLKTQEKIVEVLKLLQNAIEQIKTQSSILRNLKQKLLNDILG